MTKTPRRSFSVQTHLDELEHEMESTSDRGVCLVGLAGLERMLEALIETQVAPTRSARALFERGGPAETMAQRVTLAHALGLLSVSETAELNTLRRIRNEMAHELEVSFGSDSIADRCASLVLCDLLYEPDAYPHFPMSSDANEDQISSAKIPIVDMAMPDPANPRARFSASVTALAKVLGTRIEIARNGKDQPEEFDSLISLLDHRIEALREMMERRDLGSGSFESAVLGGWRSARAIARASLAASLPLGPTVEGPG